MFGLSFIISVILIVVIRVIINSLWFSKLLFGNLTARLLTESTHITTNNKLSYFKFIIVAFIKAIIIYLITYNIYFFLPATFFIIVFLVCILSSLSDIEEAIWGRKKFGIYLLHASENFIFLIISFMISLIVISSF